MVFYIKKYFSRINAFVTFLFLFIVLQIKCTNSSTTKSQDLEIKWNSGKNFSDFMCPDVNNFCINGSTPIEKFVKIEMAAILHEKFKINNDSFQSHRFCVKSIRAEELTLILCKIPLQLLPKDEGSHSHYGNGRYEEIKLRKCCEPSQKVLMLISPDQKSMTSYECVPSSNDKIWNPAIYNNKETNFGDHIDLQSLPNDINYKLGFPNCKNFKELDHHQDIWFKILKSGQVVLGLKFWFRPTWLPVGTDNQSYCLDELDPASKGEADNGTSHEIFHKNQVLIYCGIERFDSYLFHRKLFGTLCVTAACIILVLLVIYLSIWDRQNLAGWTQFNIFVAVFFVFGMEGVRTLADYNAMNVQASTSCLFIAAIAQYFFFALNTTWCVMNFDLFWTFWKLESSVKGARGHGKRIFLYIFFSWGLPLLMIIAFLAKFLQTSDSKSKMEGVYAYAHRRCSSPIREFGFQTQGVMFLCNVVFFGCTGMLLWRHRRGITNSRRNSRSERHTWRSVILFGKLLIVMGVSSLSIPMDYFFGIEDPLNPFAVLFRMVHFIPVVAIFFIFGFNEKNMGLIKQKYPNFGQVLGIQLFSLKPNITDTNPSQSNGGQNQNHIQNVTEIR